MDTIGLPGAFLTFSRVQMSFMILKCNSFTSSGSNRRVSLLLPLSDTWDSPTRPGEDIYSTLEFQRGAAQPFRTDSAARRR